MKIDWHIHTVLSPCASLDMSPVRILSEARRKGIDVVGICDHNSTRQARLMAENSGQHSVKVLPGVELNSSEEIHCLAFFDDLKALDEMQVFIDAHLNDVLNKPEIFGDQVVVDFQDRILYEEKRLLHMALEADLDTLIEIVSQLGGLIIPAHVDKPSNSLNSQLGYIPEFLPVNALEVFAAGHEDYRSYAWVYSSDAHYPDQIGQQHTILPDMKPDSLSIEQLKLAIKSAERCRI